MKKLTKFLIPFLALSSAVLTGCKDNRILLTFGDVHASETKEIACHDLDTLINNKDNFLFVVSTNTCSCWNDFKPNINAYVSENKALCYRIDYSDIENMKANYVDAGLTGLSKGTTTFAIFEDGKVSKTLRSSDDSKIMNDKKTFFKYMNETVKLPKSFLITKDDVSNIKASGKNAVIYYERSECGDCRALNPGILRKYLNKHLDGNPLYVLDCQPYYPNKKDPDYETQSAAYQEIKDELGLSEKNNPTYGYSKGVFPYFSLIENGEYTSGAVIYNNTVKKEDGKITVTDSYYSSERVASLQYTSTVLVGQTLTQDDVNENDYGVFWKNDAADSFYEKILGEFLDYALPKTTFLF